MCAIWTNLEQSVEIKEIELSLVILLWNFVTAFSHKDERRVRGADDDALSVMTAMDVMSLDSSEQDQEIQLIDSEEEGEQNGKYIYKVVYSNVFV